MNENSVYAIGKFTLDRYFPITVAMSPTMGKEFLSGNIFGKLPDFKNADHILLGDDDQFIVSRDEIVGYSVIVNHNKLCPRKKAKIALTLTELIQIHYSGIPMSNKDILAEISYFIDATYATVSEGILMGYLSNSEDIDLFP